MLIDNQKKIISLRLKKLFMILIYGAIVAMIYITTFPEEPYKWISKNLITIILTGIVLAYYIYNYILDQNYIYYNDAGQKIVVRFYSLRPLSNKKNSIEIAKKDLYKFEVTKKLFGLKENLVLYQKTKSGIAKYPPICLSTLSKDETLKLKDALRKFIPDGK